MVPETDNTERFRAKLNNLEAAYESLITRENVMSDFYNGIYTRYLHPVLTAAHTPLFWRYDLNPESNPHLMERMGIEAAFNAGAIKWKGKYLLAARVEGADRKSFLAIAESPNGIDNFRFWDYPVEMPENSDPDTNVYDVRLISHEDGWIYGIFCTERREKSAAASDTSAANAQAGIARTRDLVKWERLPDLKSPSAQQRNVVLHPEFVDGKYAFYTRPQDGFIDTGTGGGIGWALCDDITRPVVEQETIIDERIYHTIKEVKNGQGPAPIKTPEGWLHLAHGVRNTASGLRYVLYMFMTAPDRPDNVIYRPGGYFLVPDESELVGDVYNVAFCNGWIADDNGDVFIYYATADTRMHVATSTIARLIDYVKHTPEDPLTSAACVRQRYELIRKNLDLTRRGKK